MLMMAKGAPTRCGTAFGSTTCRCEHLECWWSEEGAAAQRSSPRRPASGIVAACR
jgi:hypothetical protein